MAQTQKKKTRREKLLAMAHIAQKELGIPDGDMRMILAREFKKNSRADLTELELGYLIDWFRSKGWQTRNPQPATRNPQPATRNPSNQVKSLRTRATEIAAKIENGEARLKGLAKKILGVDSIAWSRDVGKLRRLLAVLEKIKKTEGEVLWD